MNFYITQTINIQKLSIGSISNSSVVQIGTTGSIIPRSELYNTGAFKAPAPQLNQYKTTEASYSSKAPSLVPLAPIR